MKHILAILLVVNLAIGSSTNGNLLNPPSAVTNSIKRVSLRQPAVAKPSSLISRRNVLANQIAACQAFKSNRTTRLQMTNFGVYGGLRPN